MSISYLENGYVYDEFQMSHPENGSYPFGCAIVMPREQYEALTPEEIQKIKEDRYYKWYDQLMAASSITTVDNSIIEGDYVVIEESANTEII
jgi:hypothetical protein